MDHSRNIFQIKKSHATHAKKINFATLCNILRQTSLQLEILIDLIFIISQWGLYGIIVCGINCCRVWFGPLPLAICNLNVWVSSIVVWYSVLTLFFIYLAKFMYICIWKHMRDMNDDLIVTFLVRISIFFGIWASTTGFSNPRR